VHDQAPERHVTDEDLLLDYYDEGPPDHRASLRVHLETCARCRALDRELRSVLALVETTPLPEAPSGFERDVWAGIEPQIRAHSVKQGGSGHQPVRYVPRWVLAGGLAALLVASFSLGRVWDRAPVADRSGDLEARGVSERLIRSEVEDHLERSQRALVELVNDVDSRPLADDRARAADLVAAGRLYRRSAEEIGDADTRDLLEDVERILVEVANGSPDATSNDLTGVRTRIGDQDLIFRLRMATAEMRERERRAIPTW
jgi:anti-sigma factor RsiW